MDLVGNDVPQVDKHRFVTDPKVRYAEMLDYLRKSPGVRDVVVSGGDVANLPFQQLEALSPSSWTRTSATSAWPRRG